MLHNIGQVSGVVVSTEERIREKVQQAMALAHCEVANESHGHNVPKGSETHFRLVLVSDGFDGMSRVARHRQVYSLLSEELQSGVHALALGCYTPAEWAARDRQARPSPDCRGGERKAGASQ